MDVCPGNYYSASLYYIPSFYIYTSYCAINDLYYGRRGIPRPAAPIAFPNQCVPHTSRDIAAATTTEYPFPNREWKQHNG